MGSRSGLLVLLFVLSSLATAANFSFTGTFVQDDNIQLFLFSAPSPTVMLRTWGYAGGVNTNGDTIAPGGFDPVLSVFDITGGFGPLSPFVGSNNDGAGVDADPVTFSAFDSLLQLNGLDPLHIYLLVLTESDNLANGPTYGDGFTRDGQGNFTPSAFGCAGTDPFCDANVTQRNGQWAVDISGVGAASTPSAATPEPSSFLALTLGVSGLLLLRRRRTGRAQ
jgi:hypothetical protein